MSVPKVVLHSAIVVLMLLLTALVPVSVSAQAVTPSTAEPAPVAAPPPGSVPPAGVASQASEATATVNGMPTMGPDGLPQLPPRAAFDPILQRPLFSSSRRPDLMNDNTPASESDLRNTWKLTGVVRVDQELRALFSEINGDRKLRLSVGMPLDANWSLAEINPHSVVLNNGEQKVEMELFVPRPVPETPTTTSAQSGQNQSRTTTPNDKVPASIEERTRAAAQQLRKRVDAAKGGTQ